MKRIKCCPDKSITHRSIMIGSIANGNTIVNNFLKSDDCLHTINIFKQLGVNINEINGSLIINGVGLYGLKKTNKRLDCGNSGTSMRLISGILAGQTFSSIIYGDESLSKRPMLRIIKPLKLMNAKVHSKNNLSPLKFEPSNLNGIFYDTKSSSAQVKSCLLFAGLYANSKTSIKEMFDSRNHTEIMLKLFGADIEVSDKITLNPTKNLFSTEISIPNDISAASFFIAYSLLKPNMELIIPKVNVNSSRIGILNVLKRMGAKITFDNYVESSEPFTDIIIRYTKNLNPTDVYPSEIPSLIDEIPILSLIMSFAKGKSNIFGIKDLKHKESDRIYAIASNLKSLGVDINSTEDTISINGEFQALDAHINTYNDHRIAMTFSIAKSILNSNITIDNINCIKISYPNFFNDLKNL